ncbi:hypothetical protein [Corallibacter sp.]|uniref:hypothetical protein n=1 Tax=Corallibacter sp. TaxID=2038084 RepID=UPI003A8E931A
MLKIYYPKAHYNPNARQQLFPLLKPFIKNADFTNEQRVEVYGISSQDVSVETNLNQANVAILTMSWNYYYLNNKLAEAHAFIEKAQASNIPIWITMQGDLGLPIPSMEHVIVFRASGYKSKLPDTHKGLPIFINDPLKTYYKTTTPFPTTYQNKPLVGFCGQATTRQAVRLKEVLNVWRRNILFRLGKTPFLPEQVMSTSYLRGSMLDKLSKAPTIEDTFILRKKYRAGAQTQETRYATTMAFYNNIKDTNYVLCVRGAGNFSVRFYETLAMGRIPVYIHTDGLLPLEHKIPWKKHVVWVDYKERHLVVQKVAAFHEQLSPKAFKDLCMANRALWEDLLTLNGFFKQQSF